MKKFLTFLMILVAIFAISSCSSCTNEVEEEVVAEAEAALVVEDVTGLDRQAMFLEAGADYRWFETGVVLKDWLDEECDGAIKMVVNVFQSVVEKDGGADTWVYKFQHFDGDTVMDKVHGFWVEDLPLNDETIQVTFAQAFEKVMEVNLPKPHTQQVVLRKQIGPKACNPQWIFGNARAQIYVDAVTGAVTDKNPAFEGLNLGTPLGEWP